MGPQELKTLYMDLLSAATSEERLSTLMTQDDDELDVLCEIVRQDWNELDNAVFNAMTGFEGEAKRNTKLVAAVLADIESVIRERVQSVKQTWVN